MAMRHLEGEEEQYGRRERRPWPTSELNAVIGEANKNSGMGPEDGQE